MARRDPAPDALRDPRLAAAEAQAFGWGVTQSWRWHCAAWPQVKVSLSSWRRYYKAAAER